MKGLTPKQRRFCYEYMIDLNATQAAIRAGYTPRSASVTAARMLAKANISNEINIQKQSIAARNDITVDYLIQNLKSIVDADIKDYFEPEGESGQENFTLRKGRSKNIKRISLAQGSVSIEMYSRLDALVQLGRHIGFFNDEQTTEKQILAILTKAHESNGITEDHLEKIANIIYNLQKKNH